MCNFIRLKQADLSAQNELLQLLIDLLDLIAEMLGNNYLSSGLVLVSL